MPRRESCGKLVARTGQPDQTCLQAAARHVAHEIWLLTEAWNSRGLHIGWTLWFITARELMDFFFHYQRSKNREGEFSDHILAADYLEAGRWKTLGNGLKSQQPPEYGNCRTAANKLSAHLTYSRIDLVQERPLPPFEAVHNYLLGVAAVWLAELPPERRVWFGAGP